LVHVLVASSTAVATYDVTDEPLSSDAFHVTVTRWSPRRPVTPVGAAGTVAGMIELLSAEAGDVPCALLATTVNVYKVPFERPVIAHDNAAPFASATTYVQFFAELPTTLATYDVIALVPTEEGAPHEMVAR
jgi:hypothetical protein